MTVLRQIRNQASSMLDMLANELIRSEGEGFGKTPRKLMKTKMASPEADVKRLIMTANTLEDIWQFLVERLRSGSEPEFMIFSIVDEVSELFRLRYLALPDSQKSFQGEFIPLCDKSNHFVKTVLRTDTTFTNELIDLGREVLPYLPTRNREKENIFSIPLVAGNRTIAVITLGFEALDSFSQAKLSYTYLLRDQLAQVVWNLILQERIQNQPQLDNLTGLITHSSFHQVFQKELRRAKFEKYPLSLILLDINDLKIYNTQYSHQMGDRALARLASIIKHHVRGIDTIARYGNDEIAVIIPETDPTSVMQITESLIEAVKEPHKSVKPFTISAGIVTYPNDSLDIDTLMQIAENTLQFGKHKSDETHSSSITLATDLAQASDQDRIEVFTEQIARKYGETGSELFETLMRRIEKDAQLENENLMLETVASLAGAMDAKDKYTRGHSQSVANYAVALSHAVGLLPAEVEKIRLAAFFHDIGKIGIPESILNKPGPLTVAEKEIMDQHPVIGAQQILYPVTALRDIVPLVEYHHERWDGEGHPARLKGENIPMGARIVSIVDAFHALTSDRPYRKAMPLDQAMAILHEGAGSIWDPNLIQKFADLVQNARCQPGMEPSAVVV